MKITEAEITLNCKARTREEALQLAASELSKKGAVEAGFFDALTEREKALSTWIGAGLAMPHVNRRDSSLVRNSSFHILQFPDGVKWEKGHIAFLVVVVAAKENEHLDILSGLADLLGDEQQVERLSVASTPADFIRLMN